ncbi:MAG TPA: hypothetical protein PKJ21_07900, partial [Anaerolineae bacterium]|nr:hypothetical protein [Anaerolineae bacterium]
MTDQDRIRELNERARNRIRAHRDSADRALAELWGLRRLDTLEAADTGNLEARVAAYEIRLRLRLEEHVRHSEQAIRDIWYSVCPAKAGYSESEMAPLLSSQAACGGREHINLVGEPSLQAIDASFQQAFGLDRYFSANLSAYPTLYCETLEEFVGSWMALLDISESARQAGIVREAARLAADAERGIGLWGVNFPGRGCYLNGWMFAYGRASSAAAALRDPAIFPHIVGTVAHEKLGHGFVALYTESGREQQQLEMWRFDAAQRFGQRVTDTPEAALLEQKHAVLAMGSRYLEEGWATWIEHHIMSHLASTASAEPTKNPRVPRYSLEQLWNMLTKLKSDL